MIAETRSYIFSMTTKRRLCMKQIDNGKGATKLGNIVAETMFLFMSPGVAKLGNVCFGRKICVREAKTFLTPWQKHLLFPSSKICFRNTCFQRG